jgi:hypothetical protein
MFETHPGLFFGTRLFVRNFSSENSIFLYDLVWSIYRHYTTQGCLSENSFSENSIILYNLVWRIYRHYTGTKLFVRKLFFRKFDFYRISFKGSSFDLRLFFHSFIITIKLGNFIHQKIIFFETFCKMTL